MVHDACAYHGWPALDDALILGCRREAERLAGGSPEPVVRAAALFFAFSREHVRLGLSSRQLPRYLLRDYTQHAGIALRGLRELGLLQSKIRRGAASFADVKRWFEEHAGPDRA